MITPFDTSATTRRLVAAGIATKQAEAIVFAIQESRDTADTKRDLDPNVAALRAEMKANTVMLRAEMKANTAMLRAKMKANTAMLRAKMKANTAMLLSEISAVKANLRADMGKLRGEIYRALWVQGLALAGLILATEIF